MCLVINSLTSGKSPRGPSTFTQRFDYTFKNGIINGTFSSSRNLVAPRVSDAQSGNEETDAMLSVNAVLFYDNAKEFSLTSMSLNNYRRRVLTSSSPCGTYGRANPGCRAPLLRSKWRRCSSARKKLDNELDDVLDDVRVP